MSLHRLLVLPLAILTMNVSAQTSPATSVRLAVFPRGLDGDRLYVGEPLRIGVLLEPAPASSPVRLQVPNGAPWSAALRVRLHSEDGRAVLGPAVLVDGGVPSVLDLRVGSPAAALWRWPAETLANLPPGRYRISARLLSPQPGEPPLAFAETSFVLAPAPSSPSPAERARWLVRVAHDAFLAGESARASTLLDQVLRLEPNHSEALRLREALSRPPKSRTSPSPTPPTVTVSAAPPTPLPTPGAQALPSPRPAASPVPLAEVGLHWAVTADASSEYRATDYSRSRATGAPDVPRHGDHTRAWAPKLEDGGVEWLELTYAEPVRATEVRVVQSFNPGALTTIELRFVDNTTATVWQGPDATDYPAGSIGILRVSFPRTEKAVARVRLTLDTRRVKGWNEIDAVALVGER